MTTLTAPAITYRLPYDRETGDHNCLVKIGDDPEQSIGFAPTFHEAEIKCRNYIHDLLASGLFQTATALDGVCSCGATFNEYGQCEVCMPRIDPEIHPGDYLECFPTDVIDDKDDPSHDITLPDPAECPDISAPQPVENLSACERYSTPPSLALWGEPNPTCAKCGWRHDRIISCSSPTVVVAPEPCAEMRAALEEALEWWDNVPKTINHMRPAWVERARAALKG